MEITEEHIRYGKHCQIARLLEVTEQTVYLWTIGKSSPNETVIAKAKAKGIDMFILLAGVKLRRRDDQQARVFQQDLKNLLGATQSKKESAA